MVIRARSESSGFSRMHILFCISDLALSISERTQDFIPSEALPISQCRANSSKSSIDIQKYSESSCGIFTIQDRTSSTRSRSV